MSGPGAEDVEDLDKTLEISSLVTWGTSLNMGHSVLLGGWAWAGKKCSTRASLTCSGESAPGSEGNLGVLCPAAMRFAFQTDRWSADRRKSPQWSFFGFLTALKYANLADLISLAVDGDGCFL